MFCTRCGAEIADGAKFCSQCGTPIESETTEPEDLEVKAPVEDASLKVAAEPACDPYARFRAPKGTGETEPDSDAAPEPEPLPEPAHALSPLAAASVAPEPVDELEPVSEPSEEPLLMPEPAAFEPEPEVPPVPEPVAETEAEPVAEPVIEPEPAPEPMPDPEPESEPEPVTEAPAVVEPSPETPAAVPKQKSQIGKSTKIVAAAAIVALLAGGGGAGYYFGIYKPEQERLAQEAYEAAHSLHTVTIAVTASGWDTGNGATRLPVHIVGKDLDKKKVDKIQYVDSSGKGIELKQGSYEVTVPASPIAGDGTIYTVPDATVKISIDSDAEKDQAFDISSDHGFELAPTDPTEVTDEQIQAAYEYAIEDKDWDSSNPDALKEVATAKRDEAVTAAARYVVVKGRGYDYEFDLPAYWDNRVNVVLDDSTYEVRVVSSKYPAYTLFTMSMYYQGTLGDDIDPFMNDTFNNLGDNAQAVISATNWGNAQASLQWVANGNSDKINEINEMFLDRYSLLPDDVLAELIDLQSGGAHAYADFQSAVEAGGLFNDLNTSAGDYIVSAILPTLKITAVHTS